jgi:cytochrome c556
MSALVLSLAACASTPGQPPQQPLMERAVQPPARLEPPESLPGPVRAILKQRMKSHAADMGALMSAIMVLDYPVIRDRATGIANDGSLARPLSGDASELNAALPPKFFTFQDELRERSKALAAAADHQNAFEVADAYGELSQTCVRCHGVYRQGIDAKAP